MKQENQKIRALCPHCKNYLVFHANVRLDGITTEEDEGQNSSYMVWKDRLSEADIALLDRAKSTGIIQVLQKTLENSACQIPKNVEKFFLGFLRESRTMTVPRVSLDLLVREFGGQIEVYQYQQIVGIVSDKQLVMFAPLIFIGPSNNSKKRIGISYEKVTADWIRTKMGYVPAGAKLFSQEMARKHFGDFGKLTQ